MVKIDGSPLYSSLVKSEKPVEWTMESIPITIFLSYENCYDWTMRKDIPPPLSRGFDHFKKFLDNRDKISFPSTCCECVFDCLGLDMLGWGEWHSHCWGALGPSQWTMGMDPTRCRGRAPRNGSLSQDHGFSLPNKESLAIRHTLRTALVRRWGTRILTITDDHYIFFLPFAHLLHLLWRVNEMVLLIVLCLAHWAKFLQPTMAHVSENQNILAATLSYWNKGYIFLVSN